MRGQQPAMRNVDGQEIEFPVRPGNGHEFAGNQEIGGFTGSCSQAEERSEKGKSWDGGRYFIERRVFFAKRFPTNANG